MNSKSLIKKIMPSPLKKIIRIRANAIIRKFKAPRMLLGFENHSGEYHEKTRISDTVYFYHPEAIRIDDNVFIWHYTILDGTGGLEIGEGTQIGAWVGIFTHSSHIAIRLYGMHYQNVPESEKIGYPIAPVKIGKYVFVGAGSKILPGVSLGNGALISAGSIVNRDVNAFDVVAGNPAKVIGNTKAMDDQYLKDPQFMSWYNEWCNTL
jgi:acetyltransferase-like isoleucine patch superfamily enzyme